jgi:hypothetical protein
MAKSGTVESVPPEQANPEGPQGEGSAHPLKRMRDYEADIQWTNGSKVLLLTSDRSESRPVPAAGSDGAAPLGPASRSSPYPVVDVTGPPLAADPQQFSALPVVPEHMAPTQLTTSPAALCLAPPTDRADDDDSGAFVPAAGGVLSSSRPDSDQTRPRAAVDRHPDGKSARVVLSGGGIGYSIVRRRTVDDARLAAARCSAQISKAFATGKSNRRPAEMNGHVWFSVPNLYTDQQSHDRTAGSRLTLRATLELKRWLAEPAHWMYPYPSPAEKNDLAVRCDMTAVQVANWFRNERKRVWLPLQRVAEEVCETLLPSSPEEIDADLASLGNSVVARMLQEDTPVSAVEALPREARLNGPRPMPPEVLGFDESMPPPFDRRHVVPYPFDSGMSAPSSRVLVVSAPMMPQPLHPVSGSYPIGQSHVQYAYPSPMWVATAHPGASPPPWAFPHAGSIVHPLGGYPPPFLQFPSPTGRIPPTDDRHFAASRRFSTN